jgi:carboxyl-terminal processing protease
MLGELQDDTGECDAAREVGRTTRDWVRELGSLYSRARARAREVPAGRARELAQAAVYEDDPVTRPGRVLAADMGDRAGRFQLAYGQSVTFAVQALESRLFPELGVEDWTRVVLAAAVRAYVPLADPHGQWAPLDEEWSLYAGDSAFDPGPALWGRMTRTALGVRLLDGAAAPLARDDLVLSVGGIATAGLSVEQIEQLGRLESIGGETLREVVVLRANEPGPRTLRVEIPQGEDAESGGGLEIERVEYADGHVAVFAISDVTDSLGEELMDAIARLGRERERPLGVLLDLRGNGGGSTDGAAGAIGVFLPGVPSFPMRRRIGAVEVEHASTPPSDARWAGPVASLVDGHTASAAEMIAGALASYGRGTVVGSRTFGKGCVQEYFDDRAGAGVLRLTTMVFALPDGSPLQGVGLSPGVELDLPRVREKESLLGFALPWRGPDVRDRARMGGARWPSHLNRVGPCRDRAICAALHALGETTGRRSASSRSVLRRLDR